MVQELTFDLVEIPQGESRREAVLPGEAVGLDMRDVALEGPVRIGLVLYRSGDSIRVQGEFQARVAFSCGRCLKQDGRDVGARFEVYCERRDGELGGDDRSALEEGGLVFHDGKVLDLFEEIRQSVVLEIPWHPVCREDCRGLCPRCGCDRNRQDCHCAQRADSRWAPLKNLLR